jgi:hypothetical protein
MNSQLRWILFQFQLLPQLMMRQVLFRRLLQQFFWHVLRSLRAPLVARIMAFSVAIITTNAQTTTPVTPYAVHVEQQLANQMTGTAQQIITSQANAQHPHQQLSHPHNV